MSARIIITLATIVLATILSSNGQGILIDDFQVRQPRTFVNSADGMGMSVVRNDALFAGERKVRALFQEGPSAFEGVSCILTQGVFAISCDNQITGGCWATYTGPEGADISPPRDLTACGGWYSFLEFSDNPVNVTITAYTPMGPLVSFEIFEPVTPPGRLLWLPFVQPLAGYMVVQKIDYSLVGGPDLDSSVSQICCTPPVACWHNFTVESQATEGFLQRGDSIRATISCQNFGAPPTKTDSELAHITFQSPPFGVIVSQSVECELFNMGNVVANQFMHSVNLDVGQTERCSFIISFIDGGFAELQFSIVAGGSTSLSHEGQNRAGTFDLCSPASPSGIAVRIVDDGNCPPFNFTEGISGTWQLDNSLNGAAAPPLYCIRFDELLPGMDPVTFGCDDDRAFLSLDGQNDRMRLFGYVSGGRDIGQTWELEEEMKIDVWYTGISYPSDGRIEGLRGEGFISYRGEVLEIRGVGRPSLFIEEEILANQSRARVESWLVTTNGTAVGAERGDWLANIGDCISEMFNATAIF